MLKLWLVLRSIVFNSKFHTYFHAFHLCSVGWELNCTCNWVCFIFYTTPNFLGFFFGCNEPIWLVHCKRSFSKFGYEKYINLQRKVKLKNASFFCAKLSFILFWPVLGEYLENPNILTKYCLRYHFWNPLDIKIFDIQNDILIFRFQNNDIWSYNIWTRYFFWKYDIQCGY